MKKEIIILSVLVSTTLTAFAMAPKGTIDARNLAATQLTAAAKISSSQAAIVATNVVQGNVLSVSLEKEDGFLVYAVEIVNPTTGLNEINVDAGDGKILSKELKHDNDQAKETAENNEEEND